MVSSESSLTIAYLIAYICAIGAAVVIAAAFYFAQLRLFSIDRTLRAILEEIRLSRTDVDHDSGLRAPRVLGPLLNRPPATLSPLHPGGERVSGTGYEVKTGSLMIWNIALIGIALIGLVLFIATYH